MNPRTKPIHRGFLVLLMLLASPLAAQTRPATAPVQKLPPGTVAQRDIQYGDGSDAQKLDLYLPEKPDAPLPIVVYIHGGGWAGGDKRYFPALPLVSQGYAIASINYRFVKESIFPAQIYDCKGAIRWLRAHARQYHLDPDHIGVWGDSAGGHLVALLGASGDVKEIEGTVGGNRDQSSRVQCVIDFYGPTDMSVFFDQADKNNIFTKDPEHSPIAGLFGGMPRDHLDLVRQANPISFVSKDDPPFLILHGDKDTLVPLAQSQILVEALKKAGVDVHLEVIEGGGHGGPGFFSPPKLRMILDFLKKHLKNGVRSDTK